MRKRIHKVANFLAFNLLFFALYLNFIYKDPSSIPPVVEKSQQEAAAAFSGTLTDEKAVPTKDAQVLNAKPVEKTTAKGTH